jgi:predicted outer membrane repeat protein
MGEIIAMAILLNEASGVTYCVIVNDGANCDCPTDRCCTLQYLVENTATTINSRENVNTTVTMHFMPGTHNVNFTISVNITVPARLILNGSKHHSNVTVRANRACYLLDSIVECGLLLEHINVTIMNVTFHNVSIKLNYANMSIHNCLYLSQSLLNIDHSAIIFNGSVTLANSSIFTVYSYFGTIVLAGNIIFTNNIAYGGGAMYLDSSSLKIVNNSVVLFSNNIALDVGGALYLDGSKIYIEPGANVTFANNSAYDKGGAIYFGPGITLSQILSQNDPHKCFFHQSLESGSTAATYITFTGNTADNAGDDIYGASLNDCSLESNHYYNNTIHRNDSGSAVSLVSSDPLRICVCDKNDNGYYVPQCNKTNLSHEFFPGEIFNLSVAIVGWDFNTTNGIVYLRTNSSLISDSCRQSVANGKKCTNIMYSLRSQNQLPEHIKMYLTPVNPTEGFLDYLLKCDDTICIHYLPLIYDVTLRECPPGFYLSDQRCTCYLLGEVFKNCIISSGIGFCGTGLHG